MNDRKFLEFQVKVKDDDVIEKLDILRLERGISTNSFIIRSIAEKLQKEGYMDKARKHERSKPAKSSMSFDMEWIMRKRK